MLNKKQQRQDLKKKKKKTNNMLNILPLMYPIKFHNLLSLYVLNLKLGI